MKASELRDKLLAEGCSESLFAIQSRGSDVYCLYNTGNEWIVFYTERGLDSEPIFKSPSEDEACNFFYDYIMKLDHWHIVGFFKDEESAIELEAKISAIGAKPKRNDIPNCKFVGDRRYRVFVMGKDIFKVRATFGEIKISHE